MNYYKLHEGNLIVAPKNHILEDGTTILNFDLIAKEYGYKELVIEDTPPYDERYQNIFHIYEETETNIIRKFKVVESLSLEDFKLDRLSYFNEYCNRIIQDGFISLGYKFIFDLQIAQGNFTQQLLMLTIDQTIQVVEWKTEDKGNQIFSREQFMQIIKDAQIHKRANVKRYWDLKNEILDATSFEVVLSMKW